MSAQPIQSVSLVQLAVDAGAPANAGRVLRTLPLPSLGSGDGRCVLGRGEECAAQVDDPSVSREHVEIRSVGGRFGIADLGSANGSGLLPASAGTTAPVPLGSEMVALQHGDLIVLAGTIFFRFEVKANSDESVGPAPRRLAVPLAVTLLALLALAAAAALRFDLGALFGEDPLLVEARGLAIEAAEAAEANRHEDALRSFRSAVGLLFGAGRLDDVSRGDVVRVGLERLGNGEADGAEFWALFQRSLELREQEREAGRAPAKPAKPEPSAAPPREPGALAMTDEWSVGAITESLRRDEQPAAAAAGPSPGALSLDERMEDFEDGWNEGSGGFERASGGPCELARARSRELPDCLVSAVDQLMIDLRQDTGNVPSQFPYAVGRQMLKEHRLLTSAFGRRELVEPMMRKALIEARLPVKLHYVALIESGYRRDARSPAGATGLWQFMEGTGKQYGLRIGGGVDERRDPFRSSQAAARYLRDLTFEFGGDAILLALASYNRGENAVRRSLKKLDDPFSDRSYWRLVERDLLPEETALYVTRFAAAAIAGEHGLPAREELEAAFGR